MVETFDEVIVCKNPKSQNKTGKSGIPDNKDTMILVKIINH